MKKKNGILKPASKEEKDKALEHELGRYKKAVETREILLKDMKEEMAGQQELLTILSAYIIHLLPEGQDVHIPKEAIKAILEENTTTLQADANDTDYILSKIKKAGN